MDDKTIRAMNRVMRFLTLCGVPSPATDIASLHSVNMCMLNEFATWLRLGLFE